MCFGSTCSPLVTALRLKWLDTYKSTWMQKSLNFTCHQEVHGQVVRVFDSHQRLASFIWGSYPASLQNICGSNHVPACAWKNAGRGTWGLPPSECWKSQNMTLTLMVWLKTQQEQIKSLVTYLSYPQLFSLLVASLIVYFLIKYWYNGILNSMICCCIEAHWSSGSTFDCRSRGPWFRSYTGLMWISVGTGNESPRLHSTKVGIGTPRAVYVQVLIPGHHNVGCKQNQEWKSFPMEPWMLVS